MTATHMPTPSDNFLMQQAADMTRAQIASYEAGKADAGALAHGMIEELRIQRDRLAADLERCKATLRAMVENPRPSIDSMSGTVPWERRYHDYEYAFDNARALLAELDKEQS